MRMMAMMMAAVMSNNNYLGHERLYHCHAGRGKKYSEGDQTFHFMFLLPLGRHVTRQSPYGRRLAMLNYDHVMVPAMMATMVNHHNLLFGVQRR
jgi:hypothetical protein